GRLAVARAALTGVGAERGIADGDQPGHRLDVFPAAGADGGAPVHIFIHGGFWRSLGADLFSFLAPGFVPFGAMLVVIDYPLMPESRMQDVVTACRMALDWTYRNCADFGGDPQRIFISGNSAGGHLVAELADRAWLEACGLPRDVVKGTTAISGIFELEPVRHSFQDDSLNLTDEEVSTFSPLLRPLDLSGPMIVTVGG